MNHLDLLRTAHSQIRHLIDDLAVPVDDDGLTTYVPRPGLVFSNLIGALIRLAPEIERALDEAALDHAPPPRLFELADRIDHERLCRRAGLDRSGWTQEQKDRCDAGVHLRRYADLLGSDCWRIFPPRPGISFRASRLDDVVAMAQRDEAGRAALDPTPVTSTQR